jgi:hypothetical protein
MHHWLRNSSPEFVSELKQELNDGRAVPGEDGDCTDSPPWQCMACGHRWGQIEPLKVIGFWRPYWPESVWVPSELPDVTWLVRRGWRLRERGRILAYLRSGHTFLACAGFSTCRFWLCPVWRSRLGHRDLTDGQWVWPEGLAHYVQRHWVCLPDEFMETMRSNGWRVPPWDHWAMARVWGRRYDWSFWIAWSRRQEKRPWYALFW